MKKWEYHDDWNHIFDDSTEWLIENNKKFDAHLYKKSCSKCGEEKTLADFYSKGAQCKVCLRDRSRKYYHSRK